MTILCKRKEEEQFEEKRLSTSPGVAVILFETWDANGMMEIKRGKRHDDGDMMSLRDIDQCTFMTAITAILVDRAIEDENRREEIAIPFVMAKGWHCSLYVATMDERGIPRIQRVKYPEPGKNNANTHCDKHDNAISPSRPRTELFVALAIRLLNKVNNSSCWMK